MIKRISPAVLLALLLFVSVVARVAAARALDAPWIAADEFIYSLVGRTFWSGGGLTLFESHAPFYGLYPFLVGIPLALFGPAAGLAVMQVAQVLAASLTIVVVYVWARRMVTPAWALVAAGLTALLPALAYAGLLMTESLFLLAATLALLGVARSLAEQTLARQAVMLALILNAVMIRLQAIVFVPAVVLAVGVVAVAARDAGVIRRFAPSLVFLGVATCVGLVVRATGSASPLGAYEAATGSGYEIGTALTWIAWHLVDLALLVVVVPLFAVLLLLVRVLGGKEPNDDVRALVAIACSYAVATVVLVGVFASANVEQLAERDLISVAPPLFIALAVWLGRGMPRPQPVASVIAILLAAPLVFLPVRDIVVAGATPDALMLVPLLRLEAAGSAGTLAIVWLLTVCTVVALAALVPRRAAPALVAVVAVVLAVTSVVAQGELVDRSHADRKEVFGSSAPNWIDRATSGHVAYLYAGDPLWTGVWQQAFWNERISSVVAISGERGYGPIPGSTDADILEDGTLVAGGRRLRGDRPVVVPANFTVDGRRLATSRQAPNQPGLGLWQASDPLRLTLRVTQLPKDGVTSDRFVVEVFGCQEGTLRVGLSARADTTVATSVDAGAESKLDVPAGRKVVARVRLPRLAERRLCVVTFDPQGEVSVGRITRAPAARWVPTPVKSLRPVGLPGIRYGYCRDGTFVSMAFRQPDWDASVRGAGIASFVAEVGLTCAAPPPGYRRRGFAPAGLGVPPGVYPYYAP